MAYEGQYAGAHCAMAIGEAAEDDMNVKHKFSDVFGANAAVNVNEVVPFHVYSDIVALNTPRVLLNGQLLVTIGAPGDGPVKTLHKHAQYAATLAATSKPNWKRILKAQSKRGQLSAEQK